MHSPSSLRLLRLFAAIPSFAFVFATTARADLTFTRVFTVDRLVPDGGEYADARTLNLGGGIVTDVNVGLVLTAPANDASWAGDYYAAVGHGAGYAVLLNRIGKTTTDDYGSGANGFSVLFDDDASAGDIHAAPYNAASANPPALTGTWAPSARHADPAVVLDTTPRTAFLSSFNGTSTDGEWRLLVADDSAGGAARLSSWSLSLTFTPAGASPLALAADDTLAVSTPQILAANLVNQGLVVGPSAPGEALILTGAITGAGNFQGNFVLLGSYSPGNSPAATSFDGDTVFGPGHVLTMEIGGTAPGTGYDTITVTGDLSLGGVLNVVFLDGFIPAPSDFFQFFTATSFGGNFAQVNLPTGYVAVGNIAHGDGFTLSAIPEPAAFATLAGIGALAAFATRRKRRQA